MEELCVQGFKLMQNSRVQLRTGAMWSFCTERKKERKTSWTDDVPLSLERTLPTWCTRCGVMESLLCDEYLMCFGLFHAVGNSLRRECRNTFIAAVLARFNKLDVYKIQGPGCVRNAGACCAGRAPVSDFHYSEYIRLDTDAYLRPTEMASCVVGRLWDWKRGAACCWSNGADWTSREAATATRRASGCRNKTWHVPHSLMPACDKSPHNSYKRCGRRLLNL